MTQSTPQYPHRVWIELELPANDSEGKQRATLATKMLRRLGVDYHPELIWWNAGEGRYCICIDSGGSFLLCVNNGHWFNLELMAYTTD